MSAQSIPVSTISWKPAWRIVSTRIPSINLYDEIAPEKDWAILHELESLTNDRIRSELGQIQLVPPDEKAIGTGSGPIMKPFTTRRPGNAWVCFVPM